VHDHARGLVHGDDIIVEIQNLNREVFGFRFERRRGIRFHRDHLIAPQSIRRPLLVAVDTHSACPNPALQARAGKLR
jgi:hypothetical protein